MRYLKKRIWSWKTQPILGILKEFVPWKPLNQIYINIIKFLTHLGLQLCFPHDQTNSCLDPRKLCRSTKRLCSNFQSLGVEWQFSSNLAAADRNRLCSLDLWCLIRRFSIHPTLGLKEQYQLKREKKLENRFLEKFC